MFATSAYFKMTKKAKKNKKALWLNIDKLQKKYLIVDQSNKSCLSI